MTEKSMDTTCPACNKPTRPENMDLWEIVKCEHCGTELMIHFGTEVDHYYMYKLKESTG